jgi:hypothetical protein
MGDTGGAGSGPGGDPGTGPGRLVLYSVRTLAGMWECSVDHIYDLIARRELASTQLGTGRAKTRISAAAAADFIRRRNPKKAA